MIFFNVCKHKRTSFPITLPKVVGGKREGEETYIVCLDCAKKLPYSWEKMKVVGEES